MRVENKFVAGDLVIHTKTSTLAIVASADDDSISIFYLDRDNTKGFRTLFPTDVFTKNWRILG